MRKIQLPEKVIDSITRIIDDKLKSEELRTRFFNTLLRDDILKILDMYCTVVYYPLENESNNGFHITGIPDRLGNEHHFVYINTNQTIEKQIFTAAHELGHIWEVDKQIFDIHKSELSNICDEDIINRFAAELLMPAQEFNTVFDSEFKNALTKEGQTHLGNLLKTIVAMMSHFFVPSKAVIYRLYELGRINSNVVELLLGEKFISEADITAFINENLKEMGLIDFINPNKKKWIDGLADLLDRAESEQAISVTKLERMRETFDLPKKQVDTNVFEEIVNVSSREE